jgi:hypothetical protein
MDMIFNPADSKDRTIEIPAGPSEVFVCFLLDFHIAEKRPAILGGKHNVQIDLRE